MVQVVLAGGNILPRALALNAIDATVDTVTVPGHGFPANQAVTFATGTGGALPPPLASGTTYYVLNPTTNTFQVSLSVGGTAVVITNAGTLPVNVTNHPTAISITGAASSTLTATAHGLSQGEAVSVRSGRGCPPDRAHTGDDLLRHLR